MSLYIRFPCLRSKQIGLSPVCDIRDDLKRNLLRRMAAKFRLENLAVIADLDFHAIYRASSGSGPSGTSTLQRMVARHAIYILNKTERINMTPLKRKPNYRRTATKQ